MKEEKNMKRIFKAAWAAVFVFAMLFTSIFAFSAFAAEEGEILSFAVSAKGNEESSASLGSINWWKSNVDGKYYMFMPSNTDLSSLKVWFSASDSVVCNGEALSNGETTSVFSNAGEYTLTCNGKDYSIVFLASSKLPSLFINTPEGGLDRIHANKEHKEKDCSMLAVNEKGKTDYNGKLDSMKGRGNSTWGMAKRPYNIKLESKSKLFGMEKAKNWCLIANYEDKSLIRNQVTYGLGAAVGMEESPDCKNADVYINGEYKGVYLVTEKVEIKKNRVDIYDLEEATEEVNEGKDLSEFAQKGFGGRFAGFIENKQRWFDIPNDPEDITGGYLLELEVASRYPDEASGFVTKNGQAVVSKSPEYASKSQIQYISSYFQEMEDALYSKDGRNSKGKHFSEYIDLESFAKQYIIQEWTSNWDAGLTSNYFYKDIGKKLVAGPIWDFDTALLNYAGRDGTDLTDPTNLHAAKRSLWYNSLIGSRSFKATPNIYALGMRHADFVEETAKQMKEKFVPEVKKLLESKCSEYVEAVENSAVMNAIRWNYYSTTDGAKIMSRYKAEIEAIKSFIAERTQFLSGALTLSYQGFAVNKIAAQKFTGSPVTPKIKVRFMERTLSEGVDYTVEFSNNVQKGTAEAKIIGLEKYDGMTETVSFKIKTVAEPEINSDTDYGEKAKEGFNKLLGTFVDGIEYIAYYFAKAFPSLFSD